MTSFRQAIPRGVIWRQGLFSLLFLVAFLCMSIFAICGIVILTNQAHQTLAPCIVRNSGLRWQRLTLDPMLASGSHVLPATENIFPRPEIRMVYCTRKSMPMSKKKMVQDKFCNHKFRTEWEWYRTIYTTSYTPDAPCTGPFRTYRNSKTVPVCFRNATVSQAQPVLHMPKLNNFKSQNRTVHAIFQHKWNRDAHNRIKTNQKRTRMK